jgi:hypothetical protein
MLNHPKLWFGPKSWGEGVRPRTWEGWVLTGGVVAAAVAVTLAGYLS